MEVEIVEAVVMVVMLVFFKDSRRNKRLSRQTGESS